MARVTNPLAHLAVDHTEVLVSQTDIGVIEAATGAQQRRRPDCNTGMAAESDHS